MEVTPFTCVGDWHGAPVAPVGRREWEDIRQRPSLAELCRLIEAGNEELKRRLPVWTPHCSQFRNNHRSIADAERPLQRLMLDFDEKGHSMEILEKSRQLQEQGKWKILLVEESVRRGTHVLIALPEGMSAEEAQKRFSHDVGFQADAAVKDVSRCIYMVPMEHTLYMCQELFEVGEESIKNEEIRMMNEELNDKHKEEKNSSFPTSFKGTPYTDIIAEWFRRKGGEPVEGERNDKLFRLAVQLRCITDRNEAHLLEIMPRYGLSEEEMKNIIHSACITRYSGMSRFMESILRTLSAEPEAEEGAPEVSTFYIASESPPPMPPLKQCPPLIRLLLSNTPDIYCPAVAHAVFPALGAHLWRTYFPYIDNVLHEATFMNVLIAPTASGKSCINEPVNRIMADIRERDRANLQREKEWKKEVVSKGANKDKRGRPEGLVIQEIDPDMTNAAFVQRLADADGRFLYARMNEIDQFDALKTSAKSKAHFQIMCLAFDPGNTYGQVRVGLNSVCERVSIRFNWNASTTEHKGRSYFRSALTDGPISRINFCTIPERAIGSPMPVYGTYDAAFDEKLRPYIECLNRSQGIVRCRQAQQLATKLVGENADFARLSQSRVFENLSFRATVIAYLKAMVLYVAHGSKWDKSIERFVRWSLHYDLWCKMKYFGAQIEEEETQDLGKHKRPGPQNLLDLLPDEFTRDEAQEMRKRHRVVRGSLSLMLCNWKGRGYIEPVDTETPLAEGLQRFRKTPEYLKRKLEDT
ncbi:MAG: hypothetical protein IKW32_05205 [Bacteroidaceae bacterium]|nr:hypothetical protein [Bacteroidaceae bacterium]